MADTVKISTDRASKENNQAGCGGIIRDVSGNWVGGLSKYLGICSAFMAELWGVLEGMRLAKSLRLRKVESNVDSMLMALVLKSRKSNDIKSLPMIKRICKIMEEFDGCKISHAFRETNVCTDVLANDVVLSSMLVSIEIFLSL